MSNSTKIAIVYDWMDKVGGVERMLVTLAQMYPDADWYTSYIDRDKAKWIDKILNPKSEFLKKIHTSFIQKFPSFIKSSRILSLPFYPYAFESFDFRSYDTVISITSSFAKSVITQPHTKHICILLTPTRWLWSHVDEYQKEIPTFSGMTWVKTGFKKWDYIAAQRPDSIISISQTVADRCLIYYNRESTVIYPPFDTAYWARFKNKDERLLRFTRNDNEKYFLIVSRLEPYKKVDIAIQAFASMPDKHLVIVGKGTQSSQLKKMAGSNIKFIQNASDIELAHLYSNAQALIMPQEEDFGYVSLEAQFFGCPVISFNKGGACETVVNGKTGTFFNEQSAKAMRYAVAQFKPDKYNLDVGGEIFSKFSKKIFISEITKIV
ncbi:MAG: glycosyltransferase [bacterium]|nr:glycosyltransferase [bacterium]